MIQKSKKKIKKAKTHKKKLAKVRNRIVALSLAVFVLANPTASDFVKDIGKSAVMHVVNKDRVDESRISFIENIKMGAGVDNITKLAVENSSPDCFGFLNANKYNQYELINEFKSGKFSNGLLTNVIINTDIGLDIDGNLTQGSELPDDLIKYLKTKGIKTSLMVTNFSVVNWDNAPDATKAMMKNQKTYVAALTTSAKKSGVDEIVLDFENIPKSIEKEFTNLCTDLSNGLKNNNIDFGVCLPPDSNDLCGYDDSKISQVSNHVLYMYYDCNPNIPGALAPNSWVEQNMTDLKGKISPKNLKKIVNVFGFYGHSYQDGKRIGSVPYNTIEQMKTQKNIKYGYDEKNGAYLINGNIKIFYEDVDSIISKVDIARIQGIGNNIGIWTLNYSDKKIQEKLYDKLLKENKTLVDNSNQKTDVQLNEIQLAANDTNKESDYDEKIKKGLQFIDKMKSIFEDIKTKDERVL